MNKQFDVESAFNQYFNKVESYGLRSERFFEDVKYAFVKDNPKALIEWMKASFVMGARAAAKECVEVVKQHNFHQRTRNAILEHFELKNERTL